MCLRQAQTTKITGVDTWVTFRDGSAIGYVAANTMGTEANAVLQRDRLPLGFTVVFDTNGAKAPNIVSNCAGTALGITTFEADDEIPLGGGGALGAEEEETEGDGEEAVVASVAAACPKAERIIKDQFLIQLRGTTAQPRGAAATWAWED